MDEYEDISEAPAPNMVVQLGSDETFTDDGRFDERKLSRIYQPEKIPSTYRSKLYALTRRDVVQYRKRFWAALVENDLTLSNSINGEGRLDQLKAQNALNGVPVQVPAPPEKPSIADRLLGRENVAEYERWKERKELGME